MMPWKMKRTLLEFGLLALVLEEGLELFAILFAEIGESGRRVHLCDFGVLRWGGCGCGALS